MLIRQRLRKCSKEIIRLKLNYEEAVSKKVRQPLFFVSCFIRWGGIEVSAQQMSLH